MSDVCGLPPICRAGCPIWRGARPRASSSCCAAQRGIAQYGNKEIANCSFRISNPCPYSGCRFVPDGACRRLAYLLAMFRPGAPPGLFFGASLFGVPLAIRSGASYHSFSSCDACSACASRVDAIVNSCHKHDYHFTAGGVLRPAPGEPSSVVCDERLRP